MKIRVKTDEIELEIEHIVDEFSFSYDIPASNFLKVTKEIINECSLKTQEIIKCKNENKNSI